MALSIVCTPLTITITLSGEIVLMCGIISRPLIPAMVMSEITRSYELTRNRDRASSADDASAQSYDCSRRSCRTPRTAASSSTIRRRGLADSGIDSILQTSATIEPNRSRQHRGAGSLSNYRRGQFWAGPRIVQQGIANGQHIFATPPSQSSCKAFRQYRAIGKWDYDREVDVQIVSL